MTQGESNTGQNLLTIGQACKLLGVSEATLRNWTDEGKIKAFVTPGGHRRYVESELRSFIAAQSRMFTTQNLIDEMESEPRQKIQMARERMAAAPWYNSLDDAAKSKLRELGSTVYGLTVEYLTKKKDRDETMRSAREVGRRFGEYLADVGISLTDAIEAFIMHRSPLIQVASDIVKREGVLRGQAADAVPLVTQITDEFLLSLVEAYQVRQRSGGEGA
ncbi:MAG: helix-turn-helix domain-containing protein [Chloroflexota bacterium]|nr:helix-turn-helix domain-containing protein [Chloroflexota bacterium]